jgi:leucyl aminopeptidase
MIEPDIADLNNSGGAFAGAITAALFLERFVAEETPWCHVDLYGWNASARPGRPVGGEAQTLRAMLAALQARYAG